MKQITRTTRLTAILPTTALLIMISFPPPNAGESFTLAAEWIFLHMDGHTQGRLTALECPDCPVRVFRVTSETMIVTDGKILPCHSAPAHDGLPATVYYDPRSMVARSVYW